MTSQKLVLIVVDGMTPEAFEHGVESGRAPALAYLARARRVPPRDVCLPVTHAGLPQLDRDGRRP